ncbi:MAG: 3-isopropylmalate dehydratase small subunit [bacterium]
MEAFETFTGIVAPLDKSNVDTDQIIPKQFLKRVERTGFGKFLFYEWRYKKGMEPDPDFVLNSEPYDRAEILVARDNFGCGSSREHAPWALKDFGFRTIIAPSFADIFYNNCFKNGILPVKISASEVDEIFQKINNNPGYTLTVNLEKQTIAGPGELEFDFPVDTFRKKMLLEGLDEIDITLKHEDKIKQFEQSEKAPSPLN